MSRLFDQPAIVRSADEDAQVVRRAKMARQQAEAAEDRASPSRWDEADAYAELSARGWSTRLIAETCGVGHSSVAYFIQCSERHPVHLGGQRPSFWAAYKEVKAPKTPPPEPTQEPDRDYFDERNKQRGEDSTPNYRQPQPKHLNGSKPAEFPCGTCGEVFTADVWHCQGCNAHWPRTQDTCPNCPTPAWEPIPDPEPTAAPERAKPRQAEAITLDQWGRLSENARLDLLAMRGDGRFNAQDGDSIEWALWSWNPVTGCLHNCPYCYARDIAERFYPQKFAPSLYPSRLKAPHNTPFPTEKANEWMGHKNVFVCSMADLFGRWVPSEWIEAVLAEVRAASQWNFLFLTKFPIRMAEFDFPPNAWVGTTVDCQARVANAERAFSKIRAGVKWLSCEPLIEPLKFTNLEMFDWVVIGGSSRSTQTPEWHPPRAWITALEHDAAAAGCRVYEKTNMPLERIRQYPGVEVVAPQQAPEQLRYLPTK